MRKLVVGTGVGVLAAAVAAGGNRGYKVRYKGGYFPVPPVDHFADIRDAIVKNLEASGLSVERAHHEVGTAGQAEITTSMPRC